MDQIAVIVTAGFLLGMRHATDADHLAAIATMLSKTKKLGAAWLLGMFWGLGHMGTIFCVGALILLLKVKVPPSLEHSMEFFVGILLVLLGVLNLRGVSWAEWGVPRHSHPHEHKKETAVLKEGHHALGIEETAPSIHEHLHIHPSESLLQSLSSNSISKALGIGIVHGLAGSAAISLLVLASIPSLGLGILYLFIFGLGTLAGMLVLSLLMEASILWMLEKFPAEKLLARVTGALSLLLGVYIMYNNFKV